MSISEKTKDLKVICGKDVYLLSKEMLERQSPYFDILCNLGKDANNNEVKLHRSRQRNVNAMMHFLKYGTYYGPVAKLEAGATAWEKNCNQPAGEENGLTLDVTTAHRAILKLFPKSEHTCHMDGDAAIRACKLITSHELFEKNNQNAFECIEPDYYRCQLDLLPRPIQLELLTYFGHLRTRDPTLSRDAVFHAKMFDTAVKYMIPNMKAHIVQAFRNGAQPWVNTSLFSETSFLKAVEIILTPKFPVEDDEDKELAEALVKVMAENWGWMRHDEDITRFMMSPKYETLYHSVVSEAKSRCEKWGQKLRQYDHTPVAVQSTCM